MKTPPEFELIARLTANLPTNQSVIVGPGDDCAVLDLGVAGKRVLFKTDAVVQGIHFNDQAKPEQVGRKALARCLSDIAAMAGTPTAALVTIGLPDDAETEWIEAVYRGMSDLAKSHEVAIVGGETTRNPERVFISVALIGTVASEACILRTGSKVGDAIFVTGELGGSLQERHLTFEPRLAEARWLAENFSIHAMIDVSDGLAGDLRHLLQAPKVGAELLASAVPVSRSARLQAKAESSAKPPLLAALTDGEDFELLFTTGANDAVRLLDAWKTRFPDLRLSCVGKIIETPGLHLRDERGVHLLTAHGYRHFA